jgi:hypothetical protein
VSPYLQPALYWVAALVGLVLALLTDGVGDAIALVLLCLPLLVIGRHVLRRAR